MNTPSDPIALEILRQLLEAATEQMGEALARTAYSANITERRDHSCALFLPDGRLLAQAAHMPVHLGSMPVCVRAALERLTLEEGDVVLQNDPFTGGTHLPDITVIEPVYRGGQCVAIVCNRAHHADVGGASPGSMTLSRTIDEEGVRLPPVKWHVGGKVDEAVQASLLDHVRTPDERIGDLDAQRSSNHVGAEAVRRIIDRIGWETFQTQTNELIDYAERMMRDAISQIPAGRYEFEDVLDGNGFDDAPLPIKAAITIDGGQAEIDFAGTASQTAGPVNCPLAVTIAAVSYAFVCLADERLPHNEGMYRPIHVRAESGTLVNAQHPAAVVAGNVETSQRIVDVVLGALAKAVPNRIPAAAAGTMSSVAFGGKDPGTGRQFTYYETIPGGMGATAVLDGASAVQTHMTNTRNTPTEALEMRYPLRLYQYQIRKNSGGMGRRRGGDGVVREIEALAAVNGTLLADRHHSAPYGLAGGGAGMCGSCTILRANGDVEIHPAKGRFELGAGDRIRIETPGGGGFGAPGEDVQAEVHS